MVVNTDNSIVTGRDQLIYNAYTIDNPSNIGSIVLRNLNGIVINNCLPAFEFECDVYVIGYWCVFYFKFALTKTG